MIIDLVQDKLWGLTESKMEEINALVHRHLDGEDPGASFKSEVKEAEDGLVEMKDGMVAVIPVFGTIMKRANLMTRYSGGTSTDKLKQSIAQALDDPQIDGILLNFDSPGGEVKGTKAIAEFIFENRGRKPIVAFADGTMASAAYWIASAADKIIVSDTSMVGSIGVILTHYDTSKRDEMSGVRRTEVFSGKYKSAGSDAKPLDAASKAYLQELVDKHYEIFVADIAKNRGKTVADVLPVANGKVFIGSDALDAGLVDELGNMETALLAATNGSRRREMEMEDLIKELQAKVEALEVSMAEKDDALEAAAAREEELTSEIADQVLRSQIKERLDRAQAEWKLAPAVNCDELVAVMMALTDTVFEDEDGKVTNLADWAFENLICTEKKIESPDADSASSETAVDVLRSKEIQDGLEIAKIYNPDLR